MFQRKEIPTVYEQPAIYDQAYFDEFHNRVKYCAGRSIISYEEAAARFNNGESIITHTDDLSGAVFFSNDYCFGGVGYHDEDKNWHYFKAIPNYWISCTTNKPLNSQVVPRPGVEDGTLQILERYLHVFHHDHLILKTPQEVFDYLNGGRRKRMEEKLKEWIFPKNKLNRKFRFGKPTISSLEDGLPGTMYTVFWDKGNGYGGIRKTAIKLYSDGSYYSPRQRGGSISSYVDFGAYDKRKIRRAFRSLVYSVR